MHAPQLPYSSPSSPLPRSTAYFTVLASTDDPDDRIARPPGLAPDASCIVRSPERACIVNFYARCAASWLRGKAVLPGSGARTWGPRLTLTHACHGIQTLCPAATTSTL